MKGILTKLRIVCGLGLLVIALGGVARAVEPDDAPELDPGSMASALTLLSGGALLITARRRRAG